MTREAEGKYLGEVHRCHACKAIADAGTRFNGDPAGLFVNVRRLHST